MVISTWWKFVCTKMYVHRYYVGIEQILLMFLYKNIQM